MKNEVEKTNGFKNQNWSVLWKGIETLPLFAHPPPPKSKSDRLSILSPFRKPCCPLHGYPGSDRQWSVSKRLSPVPRAPCVHFLKQYIYNLNVQVLKINGAKHICHLAHGWGKNHLTIIYRNLHIQHKGHCCPGGLQSRFRNNSEIKYTIRELLNFTQG